MTVHVQSLVDAAVHRISVRPDCEKWAACSSIWARLWVLAGPMWRAYPELDEKVFRGFRQALALAVGLPAPSSPDMTLLGLESFDIDDDGSRAWQDAMDLTSLLIIALSEQDSIACATASISTYLEGRLNAIANDYATSLGPDS